VLKNKGLYCVIFGPPLSSQVINDMLTQQARRQLDVLLTEVCEAQFNLELQPSTTAEMANCLTFLDEIQERVRSVFLVKVVKLRTIAGVYK